MCQGLALFCPLKGAEILSRKKYIKTTTQATLIPPTTPQGVSVEQLLVNIITILHALLLL